MTITDDGVEFEIVWHGATHRESGPAPRAAIVPVRHLADEIMGYLEARPGKWHLAKSIRLCVLCSHGDLMDRLRQLVTRGVVERERVDKWGVQCWCYRLTVVEVPAVSFAPLADPRLRDGRVRRSLNKRQGRSTGKVYRTWADIAAMRARLAEAS